MDSTRSGENAMTSAAKLFFIKNLCFEQTNLEQSKALDVMPHQVTIEAI